MIVAMSSQARTALAPMFHSGMASFELRRQKPNGDVPSAGALPPVPPVPSSVEPPAPALGAPLDPAVPPEPAEAFDAALGVPPVPPAPPVATAPALLPATVPATSPRSVAVALGAPAWLTAMAPAPPRFVLGAPLALAGMGCSVGPVRGSPCESPWLLAGHASAEHTQRMHRADETRMRMDRVSDDPCVRLRGREVAGLTASVVVRVSHRDARLVGARP